MMVVLDKPREALAVHMQNHYQSKVRELTQDGRPRSLEARAQITLMRSFDIELERPARDWPQSIATRIGVVS
jgi:hypothetical protein